jgi:hypothetical protein
MGGAHNSIKRHFQRFICEGGANPPRGREDLLSECVRGCVKVRRWVGQVRDHLSHPFP